MSKYRLQHTLRVMKTAVEIAKSINQSLVQKAYIAAMYHDVCKEFDEKAIKQIVANHYDKNLFPTWHTLHGYAAAIYIQKHFNIEDQQIINAVKNHVIPPKKCDELSMIIYCADKLEPARTKQDISNRKQLLQLVKKDLKVGFEKVLSEIQLKYN